MSETAFPDLGLGGTTTAEAKPRGKITSSGLRFVITFDFDWAMVQAVKQIPGAQFRRTEREWVVPFTLEGLQGLEVFADQQGIPITNDVRREIDELRLQLMGNVAGSTSAESTIEVEGLGGTLRPFQKAGVAYAMRTKRCFIADEMGLGKRLAIGTPILTPTGWCPIENLKMRDLVMGVDGKPYPVTGVFRTEDRPLYRITFSDNVSIDADAEHLWEVQHVRNDTAKRYPKTNGRWRVLTTLELINRGMLDSAGNSTWRIPIVAPIQFPERTLSADPYTVGVVLADGSHSRADRWSVCTDNEILDVIKAEQRQPHETSKYTGYGVVWIPNLDRNRAWDKRIPAEYLLASVSQRRALLAGLLDGDGHINPSGTIQYSTASIGLAQDVVSLVQSLGGTATISTKPFPKYTYKGEKRTGRTGYVVTIRVGTNPFTLTRKATKYKPLSKYAPTRIIRSIKKLNNGAGVCISVDAPRNLYVAVHHIVTHNTVQALATIHALDAYPALVICPAALKYNWQREARKWLPNKKVYVINSDTIPWLSTPDIAIINYDILADGWDEVSEKRKQIILTKKAKALKELGLKAIVLDESHYVKSSKAQRTKAVEALARDVRVRLALSGTPLLNRPQELISQLHILDRLVDLGGFFKFATRYCGMVKTRFGMDMKGAQNLEELNRIMRQTCFIRRVKKDVLKELPAKQRTIVSMDIDNPLEYQAAKDDIIAWLRSKGDFAGASAAERAEQLVRIERLKQTAAKGKLRGVLNWIGDFLETGEKLIVFSHHKEIQHEILDNFPGAAHILGSDDPLVRQQNVDRFQKDEKVRLIVCSLQAGGVGVTLTAASNVAFIELGWNPGIHDQAEDRAHRIGQEDSVTAWYLLATGTIDEDIMALIEAKREVVNAATDGVSQGDNTGILKDILKTLRN